MWSPTGERIALSGYGPRIIDAWTFHEIANQSPGWGLQREAAFSTEESFLAIAEDIVSLGRLSLWHADTLALVADWSLPGTPMRLGFRGERDVLLASLEGLGAEITLATVDGGVRRLLLVDEVTPWGGIAFRPSGDIVATATSELVQLWSVSEVRPALEIPLPGVLELAFSQDGRRLAGRTASSLLVWDLDAGDWIAQIALGDSRGVAPNQPPIGLAMSGNGRRAAVETRNTDVAVRVWDLDTGMEVATIPFSEEVRPSWLAYNPVADEVAIHLTDGWLQIWALEP